MTTRISTATTATITRLLPATHTTTVADVDSIASTPALASASSSSSSKLNQSGSLKHLAAFHQRQLRKKQRAAREAKSATASSLPTVSTASGNTSTQLSPSSIDRSASTSPLLERHNLLHSTSSRELNTLVQPSASSGRAVIVDSHSSLTPPSLRNSRKSASSVNIPSCLLPIFSDSPPTRLPAATPSSNKESTTVSQRLVKMSTNASDQRNGSMNDSSKVLSSSQSTPSSPHRTAILPSPPPLQSSSDTNSRRGSLANLHQTSNSSTMVIKPTSTFPISASLPPNTTSPLSPTQRRILVANETAATARSPSKSVTVSSDSKSVSSANLSNAWPLDANGRTQMLPSAALASSAFVPTSTGIAASSASMLHSHSHPAASSHQLPQTNGLQTAQQHQEQLQLLLQLSQSVPAPAPYSPYSMHAWNTQQQQQQQQQLQQHPQQHPQQRPSSQQPPDPNQSSPISTEMDSHPSASASNITNPSSLPLRAQTAPPSDSREHHSRRRRSDSASSSSNSDVGAYEDDELASGEETPMQRFVDSTGNLQLSSRDSSQRRIYGGVIYDSMVDVPKAAWTSSSSHDDLSFAVAQQYRPLEQLDEKQLHPASLSNAFSTASTTPYPELPASNAMRKAASAADFRSYHSGGRSTPRNLGVLTTFYNLASIDGSQPNTDSGGIRGESAIRVSASQTILGSNSNSNSNSSNALASIAATTAASLAHPSVAPVMRSHLPITVAPKSRSEAVPPLIPQFSLSSNYKYDGQPRRRRHEIAMVTDKIRDMQYEIGRLSRKIKEYEEDTEQWSLRYSRRIVILSNISLGCWIFLLQFLDGVRTRSIKDTPITRLFIPRNILALAKSVAAASKAVNGVQANGASLPLSGVLISAFLTGVQSSLIFILSAGLQIRTQSWKRNTGFLLSTAYSLYLVLLRRKQFRPHITNYFNIVANLAYVAARYYYLHGLLVFNSMRLL